MTPGIKTTIRNFLVVQVLAFLEIISTNQSFASSIQAKNFSEYGTFEARCHPNVTYFTHGTIERQEDNILPHESQTASVIVLHGLGSTGEKAKEAVLFLKPNHSFRHIKMLFPTSRIIPYSPNNRTLSTAWFDKISTNTFSPEDPKTLEEGMQDIRELIQLEISRGIPLNRIIIGGFSLGGAMALNVAYRNFVDKNLESLAGVFALSAYLHENSSLYEKLGNENLEKAPPLFYSHGTKDQQVLYEWGNKTFQRLISLGVRGEFFSQNRVSHRISTKGINALFEWIERTLA